ncbi:MAG TPA: sugar phosphate nucleotidyltransferase [Actinophytocola sp.]|uniref:mannose-1-phosphate guanylyltransferase n=1 Tax=Actinophytocola sp. TaxID=1872138 RepID=UPI002DDD1988|nr:sugar phosphate nucleotidyltransferase [Actinophytocola sp.]HEV2781343.1 sugar phosphate nucleotidyltransferase [Actinophytocola sp.]
MAGGTGTRLWPVSRSARPKQLLEVGSGSSLLQLAFDRLAAVLPNEQIFVCTAEDHRTVVLDNLPDLPPDNLIGEPCGRDTANAVGLPAAILHSRDPDASVAFIPADQLVNPVDGFAEGLRTAFDLAEEYKDGLIALGVTAATVHTGLGYIERGEALPFPRAYKVVSFREKPDAPTARRYVDSGRHYWNTGMFVWRAQTVLAELEEHLPASYAGLGRIADAWDEPERMEVLNEVYPTLPKISIDYAVLEPAGRGGGAQLFVVELPVHWLDIGSWRVLGTTLDSDHDGNAIQAASVLVDSSGNIVVSDQPEHLVAAIGLRDMIVVHTADATMICPKNDAERLKQLVDAVRIQFGDRYD